MKYVMIISLFALFAVSACNSHENDPIQKQEDAPRQEPRGSESAK